MEKKKSRGNRLMQVLLEKAIKKVCIYVGVWSVFCACRICQDNVWTDVETKFKGMYVGNLSDFCNTCYPDAFGDSHAYALVRFWYSKNSEDARKQLIFKKFNDLKSTQGKSFPSLDMLVKMYFTHCIYTMFVPCEDSFLMQLTLWINKLLLFLPENV